MNNTLYSTEEQASRTPLFSKAEGITWIFLFGAEAIAIVIANFLTLLIFASDKQLRARSMYLLINLTIVDLLVGAFSMPDHLVTYGTHFGLWTPQLAPAQEVFFSAFYLLTLSLSLTNLAAISLERLHATVFPFRHQATQDWVYGVVIALVWSMSALVTSIMMVLFYIYSLTREYWLARISFISVSLLAICASYCVIFRRAGFGPSTPCPHRRTAREKKLTKMLFIVTSVSLITWLPLVIYATLATVGVQLKLSAAWAVRVNIMCAMLYYFNSICNPIIYSFRLPLFRKALFKREKKGKKAGFYAIKNNRQSESSC